MRDLVFFTPEYDALRCRSAVTFIIILSFYAQKLPVNRISHHYKLLSDLREIPSSSLLIDGMSSSNGG